tara:strand:- start:116 stop:310 length:195 start_codon:yes stop_codon:yes gene_type:complete
MNNEITTETAVLFLSDYIENTISEDEYSDAMKKRAVSNIQYLINWHLEPAQSDLERNTERDEQK